MDFNEHSSAFIEMQLSSISTFNIRFSHYIMKIDECLHLILTSVEEPPEELENLAAQREKRIQTEFTKRFARDYLYSIQLKMNELENEYLSFICDKNCKIAQSMVLRPLVLTLLKKLFSSTQAYLRFIKKNHSKVLVKLKEVLHIILHFLEIIKSIVDHQILKNNDIEELCSMILVRMNNEKQKSKLDKVINRKEKVNECKINKPILKKTSNPKIVKNKVHFESKNESTQTEQSEQILVDNFQTCSCSENHSNVQKSEQSQAMSSSFKLIENNEIHPVLHYPVSDLCSKISEHIVNELLVEVVKEMNDCFRNIANNAFNSEFNS